MEKIESIIKELKELNIDLYNKDWLRTWDMTQEQIEGTAKIALALEALYKENIDCRVFQNGSLGVSQFRDNSTRTRFSFASAAALLGLQVQDFDDTKSQAAHGETVREGANMISFLTECIGIRDDKFVGEGHEFQVETAEAVQEGFDAGVLHQRPSIVNLQCDQDHPTQAMCDLLHFAKTYGGLDKLKGKKIAMTWAYSPAYGKPLSVPQSIIALMTRFGMDVHLAHPEGYDLLPETIEVAKKHAEESGGKFTVSHSMDEAFKDADIVYPKSWLGYNFAVERTELLRKGGKDFQEKLDELEKRLLEGNKKHIDWECTEERMKLCAPDAQWCHCLPCDTTGLNCEHGEVDIPTFEKFRVNSWNEAGNKPWAIAAMILATRFKDPAATLEKIVERDAKRRLD
ncbi:knotted carbamoyltransferase YgeW [Carpediemonas membranifera]|uniref:ornithine carbamoyltransferase n=1 Tax=Carpediemonas membranifera TaxID=201153 RepID=A0A8J6ARH4_9EUKA|nr:knotted carbamoyltransferase YgeW [Carpediemonas membranifera]|eukprot:KAG9390365.1 knotted carbamoyltransferase YgeW [Carpediemonas membranifera]